MYMSGTNNWVLGLNFFHDNYVVFDQQNSRIGFADSIFKNPVDEALFSDEVFESTSGFNPSNLLFAGLGFMVAFGGLSIWKKMKGENSYERAPSEAV